MISLLSIFILSTAVAYSEDLTMSDLNKIQASALDCVTQKKYSQAIDEYQKILKHFESKNIEFDTVYFPLSYCYAQVGNRELSLHYASKVLDKPGVFKVDPSLADGMLDAIDVYSIDDESVTALYAKTVKIYDQIEIREATKQSFQSIYFKYAVRLYVHKRYTESETYFIKALALSDPKSPVYSVIYESYMKLPQKATKSQ